MMMSADTPSSLSEASGASTPSFSAQLAQQQLHGLAAYHRDHASSVAQPSAVAAPAAAAPASALSQPAPRAATTQYTKTTTYTSTKATFAYRPSTNQVDSEGYSELSSGDSDVNDTTLSTPRGRDDASVDASLTSLETNDEQ